MLKLKIMKFFKILPIIVFIFTEMNAQKITYYTNNNEEFADVYIEDDLIFTCRVAGLKNDGPTVILLHGFPETSRMWKSLLKLLSDKNYKVIAPDQRGYSKGARPLKVKEYASYKLSNDVINIADAFKIKKFHLVGHDWGAAVGWHVSAVHANRISSYSALSVPHLDAFGDAIANNKVQRKKSYYIKLFQLKFIPEIYFKINNYYNLKKLWTSSSDEEIKDYLSVFSQKNAIRAALNWYRASNLTGSKQIGKINVPTLMIYGTKDMAIGEKGIDETEKYIKNSYTLKKIDSSHWLIQDSFEVVSSQILNHLKRN